MFADKKIVWLKHFCLLPLLALLACGDNTQEKGATMVTDSSAQKAQEAISGLRKYSPKLQKIVKTPAGVLRGVTLGDDLDVVIANEEASLLEDSTKYVGYNVDLGNDEMVDILYYFDKKNRAVQSFTLDVYLNNTLAVDSLINEFSTYFTEKYGQPIIQEKKAIAWQTTDQTRVVLKDVGIKEAPGLQIQVAKGKN